MTNKEIQEFSKMPFSRQIYQILNDAENEAGQINCHFVCMVWISPVIKHFVERKIAYFPEYGDATEYLSFVSENYSKMSFPVGFYLNGILKFCSCEWREWGSYKES